MIITMSNYIQSNQVVTLPVGGVGGVFSISSNDSGKLLLLPTQSVAQTITMPKAQLRYRIMANTGAGTMWYKYLGTAICSVLK